MGISQPVDIPPQGMVGADFSSNDCGQDSGTASGGGSVLMVESGWLAINSNTDLSSCIQGNSGASVQHLFISNQPPEPVISACIWVYGQGPKGAGSGSLELIFVDQDEQTHSLKLNSSTPEWHYLGLTNATLGMITVHWEHGSL